MTFDPMVTVEDSGLDWRIESSAESLKSPPHRLGPILHELFGLAAGVGKPCGEVGDDGGAFVLGLIEGTVFPLAQAEVAERQAELPGSANWPQG